jgi:hypothetical protein
MVNRRELHLLANLYLEDLSPSLTPVMGQHTGPLEAIAGLLHARTHIPGPPDRGWRVGGLCVACWQPPHMMLAW